MIYEFIKF